MFSADKNVLLMVVGLAGPALITGALAAESNHCMERGAGPGGQAGSAGTVGHQAAHNH